jgi:hypothetical protein
MRGWLDKEGKGALRVWQRRYFVLSAQRHPVVLSWFVNHKVRLSYAFFIQIHNTYT